MREIVQQLQRVQRTSRWLLILQRIALVVAIGIGIVLVVALADFALRMPRGLRIMLWLAGAAGLAWAVATYIRRAVTFHPSMTALALRAEKLMPRVAGRLASAIEFSTAHVDDSNPLAARSVRETETRLSGESMKHLLQTSRTFTFAALMTAALALCAVVAFATPTGASTAAQRVLTPWSDVSWPARTGVQSLMHEVVAATGVYERGQALLLRAEVTRGDPDQRVDVMMRYQSDGDYQRWQRLVLTHQNAGIHERLIDTDATAVELYFETADARTQPQRYELVPAPAVDRATLTVQPPQYAQGVIPTLSEELGPGVDDRSNTSFASFMGSQVRLVLHLNKPLPPPEVRPPGADPPLEWFETTFNWPGDVPPQFMVDPEDESRWVLSWTLGWTTNLNLELTDRYGLTNSESITYRINARVDQPPAVTMTDPPGDQVVLPNAVVPLRAEAEDDVALTQVALEARVQQAIRDTSVEQAEPDAIASEAIAWQVEEDAMSAATSIEAELDLSQLDLTEGDAVLVSALAADAFELDGETHEPSRSAVRRLQVISELEYAEQVRRQLSGIRQNAIRLEALQSELQDDIIDDGVQPGVERAQAQIGQRIAEQRDMIRQLRDDLTRNRLDDPQLSMLLDQSGDLLEYAGRASTEAAEQIEQRRGELEGQPESREQPGEPQENQESSGEPQDAQARARANGEQAGDQQPSDEQSPSAQSAQGKQEQQGQPEAAPQAGDQQQAGDQPSDETADEARGDAEADKQADEPEFELHEPAEQDEPIVESQQKVRDELADLIELLDRDEDTWVVTRQLENLLNEQQQLGAETARLSEQTVGRSADDLTEDERTELQRIVDKQRELAEQARQLIEESRERAEALEEIDPQSASGMRTAAETAEQRELDQEMQRASQRAEQNQLNSSRAAQRSAVQTMQDMLEDIEQTKRAQAEQLLRQLASLKESIQRLVTVQENELMALAQAQADADYSGRDRAMIRLNQNTLAVEGEARAAGQQARRIARALDRAGDAQGAAVSALRSEPISHDEADDAEQRSLELLNEAFTLAEELEQQVQEDEMRRQRENLIEQYRTLAEKQAAIRQETLPLGELDELNRRQLVDARRLGNEQDELRNALIDMQAETSELSDAIVFRHVHGLIDDWSVEISDSLWNGTVSESVTDRQLQIAESIVLLIQALEQAQAPPDEFAEQDQQSGSGGQGQSGQGPLIPPIAELKLLRGMQEQIYNQTKQVEGRAMTDDSKRRIKLRELGRRQRELLDLGSEMLEALRQQQGGPQPQ